MGEPGIFVSYYAVDKRHPDYSFAVQCMRDLRMRGAEIVAESSLVPQGPAERYLDEQLSRCQWLILILTLEASRSRQVQMEVETALRLVAQQRLQGVLALMPVPCPLDALPPAWSAIRIFDADEDYARALAGVAFILNLVRLQAPPPTVLPGRVKPSVAQMIRRPLQRPRKSSALRTFPSLSTLLSGRGLFAALAIPLVLLVIFTSIVFMHGLSGTPINPATRPTPTVLSTDPAQLFMQVMRSSPTVVDALSAQDKNQWDENATNGVGCAFSGGKYHAYVTMEEHYTDCLEHLKTYSNFAFQVLIQIDSGDAGGLIFRANASLNRFYRFSLDNFHNTYKLLVCKTCTSEQDTLNVAPLFSGSVPGSGPVQLNQPYTLTVIANKNLLYLYVNGQSLVIKPDTTLQSGELGVYAFEFGKQTGVEFSNMKIWVL